MSILYSHLMFNLNFLTVTENKFNVLNEIYPIKIN